METKQDAVVEGIFRLDRLTVTRNDRAMVITGVSSETAHDLAAVQSRDGWNVDDAVRDGLVVVEVPPVVTAGANQIAVAIANIVTGPVINVAANAPVIPATPAVSHLRAASSRGQLDNGL